MRLQRRDSKVVLLFSGNTTHCRVVRLGAREKCVTSCAARLRSVCERPTHMAVENRQLIQAGEKEIDLRSLPSPFPKPTPPWRCSLYDFASTNKSREAIGWGRNMAKSRPNLGTIVDPTLPRRWAWITEANAFSNCSSGYTTSGSGQECGSIAPSDSPAFADKV